MDSEALGAFKKVWYDRVKPKDLTESEKEKLYDLYLQDDLGADNYMDFVKSRARQAFENAVIRGKV